MQKLCVLVFMIFVSSSALASGIKLIIENSDDRINIHFQNESEQEYTMSKSHPLGSDFKFRITPITGTVGELPYSHILTLEEAFEDIISIEAGDTYSVTICHAVFEVAHGLNNGSYKIQLTYADPLGEFFGLVKNAVPTLISNEIEFSVERQQKLTNWSAALDKC